jgi:hypothetical protein
MAKEYDWSVHEDTTFVKFTTVGDSFDGTITNITTADIKGKTLPQLFVDDDETREIRTLTVGTTILKQEIVAASPQIGDHLHIDFTHQGPAKGDQSGLKEFEIEVTRKGEVVYKTGVTNS